MKFRMLVVAASLGVIALSVPTVASSAPNAGGSSGQQTVRYHGLALQVPADWPVYDLQRDPTVCVRFDVHAVYLGHPGADMDCPAALVGRTDAVLLEADDGTVAPSTAPATSVNANGLTVELSPPPGQARELDARVRGAGVLATLSFGPSDATAQTVLASFAPSSGPDTSASTGGVVHPNRKRPPPSTTTTTSPPGGTKPPPNPPTPPQGFDACTAPSATTMQTWWNQSPYTSIAIYVGGALRACSQPNLTAAWKTTVSAMGWHFFPLWVGPQAPCTGYSQTITTDPFGAFLAGVQQAQFAKPALQGLGFGLFATIWYDMEAYFPTGSCSSAAQAAGVQNFAGGWAWQLHQYGYGAGLYSSLCCGINDLAKVYYTTAGSNLVNSVWIAAWNNTPNLFGFTGTVLTDQMWPDHQRVHQFRGGHDETWGGVTINLDNDADGVYWP